MRDDPPYQLLADVVLTLHFSIVAFVVGGLVLTIGHQTRPQTR